MSPLPPLPHRYRKSTRRHFDIPTNRLLSLIDPTLTVSVLFNPPSMRDERNRPRRDELQHLLKILNIARIEHTSIVHAELRSRHRLKGRPRVPRVRFC